MKTIDGHSHMYQTYASADRLKQRVGDYVEFYTAYIEGLESFATKIAAGFFDNYRLGLPTGSGMMVLVSAETGRLEAVLLDNGYLPADYFGVTVLWRLR